MVLRDCVIVTDTSGTCQVLHMVLCSERVLTRQCSIGDAIESCQKIKQSGKQGTNYL